jgi:hypothetical protein
MPLRFGDILGVGGLQQRRRREDIESLAKDMKFKLQLRKPRAGPLGPGSDSSEKVTSSGDVHRNSKA